VVSIFRTNTTDAHDLLTGNVQRILEVIKVPVLKKCQVQTDVVCIKPGITFGMPEKECAEVPDIIHGW